MSAKNVSKFKRPDEYPQVVDNSVDSVPGTPPEVFFRLKLMPAGLIQYSVEQVTVQDDVVVERRVVTERDILAITLSKIEDLIVRQIRR